MPSIAASDRKPGKVTNREVIAKTRSVVVKWDPPTGWEGVSVSGLTWTARTAAVNNDWYGVTYGNGLFVAVAGTGTGNRVMTSPDGITWTSRTSAADYMWRQVVYGNGVFVAVSGGSSNTNQVMTSTDGITWTLRTSAQNGIYPSEWYDVVYAEGLFVAVGTSPYGSGFRVQTSPDGITWTGRTSGVATDANFRGIAYSAADSQFVAVAQSGTNRVMTSPDGITWTARSAAAANTWTSVAYGNGRYVAVASTGTGTRMMSSTDAITWSTVSGISDNTWERIIYGGTQFIAVGSSTAETVASPDGVTWTAYTAPSANWQGLAYGNSTIVAVRNSGTSGRAMTSPAPGYTPGPTEGWDESEVQHYEVSLKRTGAAGGVTWIDNTDTKPLKIKGTRAVFTLTKDEAESVDPGYPKFAAKIKAIGWDNDGETPDAETGAAEPEVISVEAENGKVGLTVVPNVITLDVDQQKMTVSIAGSTNIYDTDTDLLLEGIDHFTYHIATDSAFTNIIHRHHGKVTTKTFKHSKPGTAIYYARCYLVDELRAKHGPTATASNDRKTPPAPTGIPTITFNRGGKKGIRATVSLPAYTGTYTDDDIAEFTCVLQAEESTPVDGDPRRRYVIDLEPGEQANTQTAVFEKIKAGEKVRAAYFVRDTKGHRSATGTWSSTYTAAVSRKPGAVSGLSRDTDDDGKFKTITWRWDSPTTWSDGSPIGSEDEVAGYKVTPIQNGVDKPTKGSTMHKSNKFMLRVADGSGPWTLRVEPVGWDGDVSAAATSTDGIVATSIVAADIPANSIDYNKIATNMPAAAPTANYGSPSSNGATPPRYYLPSGPSGYKNGDWLVNTGESPTRVYKWESSASRWYRITENLENVYADNIVGGTLSGVIIQTSAGGYFQTGPSSASMRIKMTDSGGLAAYLQWLTNTDFSPAALSATSGGVLGVAGSSEVQLIVNGTAIAKVTSTGLFEGSTRVSTVGHTHTGYAASSHTHTTSSNSDGHGHGFVSAGGHSHGIDAVTLSTNSTSGGGVAGHSHGIASHGHTGSTISNPGDHNHSFSSSSTTHSHSISS